MIELKPLKHATEKSNCTHAGYDEASRRLRVKFGSGKIAEYAGVTPEDSRAFHEAHSHGKHLNEFIKPKYSSWRYVTESEA